ncbi:Putative Ca2+/H+ antiporter, TMEM165/GDT1 family [Nitrosospira sp. Nl5]|nr:Putative Ca2+/H+ antiporter, TMEM165/GDT1 family [Nitrosospira sp. Nl5]
MEEEYWTEKSRYNSPLFCIAPTLEAFFTSTLLVALAEIGDKTQLLSFVLAAKLRRPYPIMAGIFAATILNHALAASIGAWLASLISPQALTWIVGLSFIGFGLWALKPDTLDGNPRIFSAGVFVTTLVAFFVAEMGDKTQFATVALAARYDALVLVVLGTTFGMVLANIPAVWIGKALADRINMRWMRWFAAASFVLMGLWSLAAGE